MCEHIGQNGDWRYDLALKRWQLESLIDGFREANEPSQDSPVISLLLGIGTAIAAFLGALFTGTPWLVALIFGLICGSIAFAFGIYILIAGVILGGLYLIWVSITWLASISGGM